MTQGESGSRFWAGRWLDGPDKLEAHRRASGSHCGAQHN
jgi:hypothetical protein